MEVPALCFGLLINTWLLLVMQVQDNNAQKTHGAFLHVIPARFQHFEYESVSFVCEGFDGALGQGVMRKSQGENTTCGSNWGFISESHCIIRGVYIEDSGEYWCETGDGRKSNAVNIAVTAGSVILESPVLPVMEGDTVTLHCRNKKASTNISTSFYKNGFLIKNVSAGHLIIHSVSKSDEGLYKCLSSGGGESPQSLLAVREYLNDAVPFCSDQLPVLLYFLIKTVTTILLVTLLLLVLRKRHSGESRRIN